MVPAKLYFVIMLVVGAAALLKGLANASMSTILLSFLFFGLAGLAYRASKPASPLSVPVKQSASTAAKSTTTQTPNMLAESIAKLIGQAFSSSHYIELFGEQSFSEDWTVQDGLAVWYFFGTMALDIAIYTTVKPKANAFGGRCDRFLSKQWRMPEAVLDKFNDVRQSTAEEAFKAFMDCESGDDFSRYSSSCVNRIMGSSPPFHGSTFDWVRNGYALKILDLGLTVAFFHHFSETVVAAKTLIREASIDWQSLERA